jgi:hypothetical protein
MGFLSIFAKISMGLKGVFSYLTIFVAIALIFLLAVVIIKYIKVQWLAVALATIGSCFLMVPLTLAFSNFVASRVGKIETGRVTQGEAIKQQIIIDGLKDTIRHLENTMFNVQEFEKILDLGLIETNLENTKFTRNEFDMDWKEQNVTWNNGLPIVGWGAGGEYYEYIEVMSSKITAKFGVDLKNIKLSYSSGNQNIIIVSGIQAKYIGNSRFEPNWEISEIRKVEIDSSENKKRTQILNTLEAERKRNQFMQNTVKNYQNRLSQGLETNFMDDSVIKLAQNFIRLVLAPLGKEVKFENNNNEGYPLLEFIENEIKEKNKFLEDKSKELLQIMDSNE